MDTSQVGLVDDFDVNKRNSGRGSIGRAPGVTNYNPDKVQILLEIVQEFVPTSDEEWELVCQKFNQTFHVSIYAVKNSNFRQTKTSENLNFATHTNWFLHLNSFILQEDRMMKSLKRKFTELVAGGTKTTSHDLTHFVNWAKKLSLRIREKTTGKPYAEPVENSGLILPPPGEEVDIQASGLPWGANASNLPTPALAPRIRKNRLSSPGPGGATSEVSPVLTFLQMQATTQSQNHQQVVGLLQQVIALLQSSDSNAPAASNKRGRGKGHNDDDDASQTAKKARAQSEDDNDNDDKRRK